MTSTAKRVYKNWPIDVMETGIYFNLVAFSALTWYNLDFGGNQVAVAYTYDHLYPLTGGHCLHHTRLYKCSLLRRLSSGHLASYWRKKPKEQAQNAAPEELDRYWLERSAAGDQERQTIPHSVVETCQPCMSESGRRNVTVLT